MNNPLVVSAGPHIRAKVSTKRIMWAVNLALIPAGAAGVFIFGVHSLYVIIASVLSAVITEWAILAFRKKETAIQINTDYCPACNILLICFRNNHNPFTVSVCPKKG